MRVITNEEARIRRQIIEMSSLVAGNNGFDEIVIPTVEPREIYTEKMGDEIVGQIYSFQDRSSRDICLRPEGTATIQAIAREYLPQNTKQNIKLWYESRCYRYERPQEGRYREFTQIGFELLGPPSEGDKKYLIKLAELICIYSGLDSTQYEILDNVKRGLGYYTEDGFEIIAPSLGAQKQICGGGRYAEGIGFAIGVDRLTLAILKQNNPLDPADKSSYDHTKEHRGEKA